MKTIKFYPVLAACIFAVTSCSNDDGLNNTSGFELIEIPTVSDISLNNSEAAISNNVNHFGMDLFKGVFSKIDLSQKPNVSVSPLSMAICLGYSANACDDVFKDAVTNTMGCKDITELNGYFNKLLRYLPDPATGCELSLANSLWHISSGSPSPTFANISKNLYYGSINSYAETERLEVANRINQWCAWATKGMIPVMVDKDAATTRDWFIFNALYFEGKWETTFDPSKTSKQTFHCVTGDKDVDMMHGKIPRLTTRKSDKGVLAYLPYKGDYYMTLLLPGENIAVEDIADALLLGLPEPMDNMENNVSGWTTQFAPLIELPKFKVSFDADRILNDVFTEMGFPKEVNMQEFNLGTSAISYLQKTAVEVDEEGTKAAAISGLRPDAEPAPLVFDRPFLYSIVNRRTGLILMTGYVGDPTVSE